MYAPKLKYAFCVARKRSLMSQLSLMNYLSNMDKSYLVYSQTKIPVTFSDRFSNTNYDVMLSESAGLNAFEKDILQQSISAKKLNVKVHNSISIYNTIFNKYYLPQRTNNLIHAMCMKDQRSIDHFKRFNRKIIYINTGDPDWDYLTTKEFNCGVCNIRNRCGNKILLLCLSFHKYEELVYLTSIIKEAERCGFSVLIITHPDRLNRMPDSFREYLVDINKYIAIQAASHVMTNVCSTIVAECLLLNKSIGVFPTIPHASGWGKHLWIINAEDWHTRVRRFIGSELLNLLTFVDTTNSLSAFLHTKKHKVLDVNDKIFGWPRVPSYCSHFFQLLENKIK
jgi:hypothetical protein